jgi:hypothetical protein
LLAVSDATASAPFFGYDGNGNVAGIVAAADGTRSVGNLSAAI